MNLEKHKSKSIPHLLMVMYLLGFLFYLHSYLPIYISSSFLQEYSTEELVGIIYTIGSLLSVIGFFLMPRLLKKFGNYKITIFLLILQFFATLGMAYFRNILFLAPLFIISILGIRLIGFNFDIFLEHVSDNAKTGGIRGMFLTVANTAQVLAPVIAGFVVGPENYGKIFLVAALILIPLLMIARKHLRHFKDATYNSFPIRQTMKRIWDDHDVRNILISAMMLQFFYSWMVIYTPIYLHEHIGFSWNQLGIMFTIMLLPFALLELPLGKIADTKIGEKELLSAGFIIIALTSASLSFVTGASILLWTILLFATRIGGSTVEIMTETYFFKKIADRDSDVLSFFRMMQPGAYVVSPLIATVFLLFVDFRWLFLILGIIMLTSLFYSLSIKDTL